MVSKENEKTFFVERVNKKIFQKQSCVIVGLDPRFSLIPEHVKNNNKKNYGKSLDAISATLLDFNKKIKTYSPDDIESMDIDVLENEIGLIRDEDGDHINKERGDKEKIEAFKTDDGEIFETENQAIEHQMKNESVAYLEKLLRDQLGVNSGKRHSTALKIWEHRREWIDALTGGKQ